DGAASGRRVENTITTSSTAQATAMREAAPITRASCPRAASAVNECASDTSLRARADRTLSPERVQELTSAALWMAVGEQIADDGDGCGAGLDHRRSGLDRDATDGDERQAANGCARGCRADHVEPHAIVSGRFRRRAEHRSDREIGDRLGKRAVDLLGGVRGEADDRGRSDNGSNSRRGEIVLAD